MANTTKRDVWVGVSRGNGLRGGVLSTKKVTLHPGEEVPKDLLVTEQMEAHRKAGNIIKAIPVLDQAKAEQENRRVADDNQRAESLKARVEQAEKAVHDAGCTVADAKTAFDESADALAKSETAHKEARESAEAAVKAQSGKKGELAEKADKAAKEAAEAELAAADMLEGAKGAHEKAKADFGNASAVSMSAQQGLASLEAQQG